MAPVYPNATEAPTNTIMHVKTMQAQTIQPKPQGIITAKQFLDNRTSEYIINFGHLFYVPATLHKQIQ